MQSLNFFAMAGNYESRKVANDVVNGAIIDTAAVGDSSHPYETGINSPRHGGRWVIVEEYDSKEDAQAGHGRWVKLFREKEPAKIKDVSTSGIKAFGEAFGAFDDED